jgi:hypothetical protein
MAAIDPIARIATPTIFERLNGTVHPFFKVHWDASVQLSTDAHMIGDGTTD